MLRLALPGPRLRGVLVWVEVVVMVWVWVWVLTRDGRRCERYRSKGMPEGGRQCCSSRPIGFDRVGAAVSCGRVGGDLMG